MPFEIVPTGTRIDFLGRRRIAFAVSATLLVAGAVATQVQGVRLGIDFAGGTEVHLRFADGSGANEGSLRALAGVCGIGEASVVRYGESDVDEFLVRFQDLGDEAGDDAECPLSPEQRAEIARVDEATGAGRAAAGTPAAVERLLMAAGNQLGDTELMRVEFVGPRVGDELRRDGLLAIGLACVFILIYIAFRFSSRFAPGAVVALVHDVGITAGLFVIFGLEFDLRVLAALLAIVGYSLNDTIIIYDRIRENMELRTKFDVEDVLNRSVNQTLARTLLTSFTTLGAVLMLLIVGGEVIRPFALAMSIGIVIGTYSSTFIAAPVLLLLEGRAGGGDAGSSGEKGGGGGGGGSPRRQKPKHPKQRSGKAARAQA